MSWTVMLPLILLLFVALLLAYRFSGGARRRGLTGPTQQELLEEDRRRGDIH